MAPLEDHLGRPLKDAAGNSINANETVDSLFASKLKLSKEEKAAARKAKAGAYHHDLATNERAPSLARQPFKAEGPIQTRGAWRARAASAPAAPPPHREQARWPLLRTCASRPRARPRLARGTTVLH